MEEGGSGPGPAWRRPSHLGPGAVAQSTIHVSSNTVVPLIGCPCVSPQSRGGPLKFELSSWLQIEGAEPEDSGTYRCVAHNSLGSVSASAVLGVLGAGETLDVVATNERRC